jgi:hypothetical protein
MNPNEFYTPPNLEMPSSNPTTPDSFGQLPTQSNIASGLEKEGTFTRSIQKSRVFKQAAKVVINTRQQLVDYLKQSKLDLLTSSVEFARTGDFITSSYVVYTEYNGYKENLSDFVERFPALRQSVEALREKLRPVQSALNIGSRQ